MSNTSSTGGYLSQSQEILPGELTLNQYLQQVFVGLTGMDGSLIRPKWQKNPPKVLPNPEDNWMAFGVSITGADANAYINPTEDGEGSIMQRHEELSILCSFYGSECQYMSALFRDSFQITQNRDALAAANMGFKETTPISFVPEVHGGVWFPRCDISVILRRQINRSYGIVTLTSSDGTIKGLKDNEQIEDVPWEVSEP